MSVAESIRGTYQRSARFFGHEIWEQRLEQLPTGRARLYGAARIVHCTLKGLLFGDTLQVRAAALTYFTVLSLVPLLAFAFALLKGFGAYDALVEEWLRPHVLGFLQGNEALRTAFEQILGFVERTGVTSLGFFGLLTLLYAATRLLHNIENAFNEIWGVKSGRELLHQMRDYVAIIVVTPICLMAAAALTTAGQVTSLVRAAGETLGIGALLDGLISLLGPLVVLFIGLTFLYKVMPYTYVRARSAIVGAAVGGVLWYVVLIVHVRFQVGVAQYNALYSSFGAIPIFLAWLQLSWLVVLVGAEIAATHQNHRRVAQRARVAQADQATKEAMGLAASLRITRAFLDGNAPATLEQLSCDLDLPDALLHELLDALSRARLVVPTADRRGFVLGRPADKIRVKDVVDALRSPSRQADGLLEQSPVGQRALTLWRELDHASGQAPGNRSLREILEGGPARPREGSVQLAADGA